MRKFLLGALVGIIVCVLAIVILGVAVARLAATKAPAIAGNSVLVLNLEGEVSESAPVEVPIPFIQAQANPTVSDLWKSLHQAASDKRIRAIVLQPRNLEIGWGKMQEIHQELLDFKRSGKPVYAYLQGAGTREYYLATAADKIYLSPDDLLDVKGLRLESMYFRNSLDKLGVTFQVDHIGKYKDAGDVLTRTNMSPETREVLNQVLDQLYGDFCNTVAQGRHKSATDVRGAIDNGPFMAQGAKDSGMVDQLGYEDQVYSDLKKAIGARDLSKASIKSYFRTIPARGDRVALIVGEGDIIRGTADNQFGNSNMISSGTFSKVIRQVRNDGSVKGAILRVDSPGGDAVASDEILHELKLLSAVKPLIISMSDVAASGGYFIAMTGDKVVAYPNTITGSIGVIYGKPIVRDLFTKLGIQEDILTRGKMAEIDSAYLPLSDAGKQKLHDSIAITYKSFVSKVASARKRTYEQIDNVAQGRVWMGAQADGNGLVDQVGGLTEAVALLRQRARLPSTGETDLVMFPPRRTLFDMLANPSTDGMVEAAVNRKIRASLGTVPSPALLRGGMLRILPYQLQIH